MLAHYAATRRDVRAGNGVALFRDRARYSSTSTSRRLLHLIQLRHHHDLDIGGDLIQQAAQYPKKAANLRNGVAHGMPGDQWWYKPKPFHDTLLDREALLTKRSERSNCASKFTEQDTSFHLIEPLKMTVDAAKPHRGLIAESKRHSLLKIASPDHRSITMISSQVRQRCSDRLHV